MRGLALLGLSLLTASLLACSDDDSDTTSSAESTDCTAGAFGVTNDAPSCAAPPPASDANAKAVQAFRAHAILSTSALGGASRFATGAIVGAAECFDRAIAAAMVGVIFGALTGEVKQTPITCNDVYDASMKYTFDAGTYSFAARQRGGSPDMPWRMDTHASVTLKVYVARDAGALKKGDAVTVDVGDPNSFLVNPRLVADASGKAAIAFDALGPLAPLLGVDASTPNPAPVTKAMRDHLSNAFEVDGSLHADLSDCASGYHSIIDQTIARAPASQPLRPQLVSATTTGRDGTRVEAKVWDATYAGKSGPSGHIEADVTGPGIVHHARIDLDNPDAVSGTLTLDCAP